MLVHCPALDIDHPIFGHVVPGIERALADEIEVERRVGHFDDQRERIERYRPVALVTGQDDIGFGHRVVRQANGNLDDGFDRHGLVS